MCDTKTQKEKKQACAVQQINKCKILKVLV